MSGGEKARLAKAVLLAEYPQLTIGIRRGTHPVLIVCSEDPIELPGHVLGVRVQVHAPQPVGS